MAVGSTCRPMSTSKQQSDWSTQHTAAVGHDDCTSRKTVEPRPSVDGEALFDRLAFAFASQFRAVWPDHADPGQPTCESEIEQKPRHDHCCDHVPKSPSSHPKPTLPNSCPASAITHPKSRFPLRRILDQRKIEAWGCFSVVLLTKPRIKKFG